MQLKRYKKDFDYSYSFGIFPTLELLRHRPDKVLRVVAHSTGVISKGIQNIEALCDAKKIPFDINDKFLRRLFYKDNIYVAAVFEKYPMALDAQHNHLMLVNPSDFGNLGSSIRSALGFSVSDLALISPAADLFNPQVVRASMGAVFAISAVYFEDIYSYTSHYLRDYYAFMLEARYMLGETQFAQPYTLIFGPEGSGLPESFRQLAKTIMIPQSELIESFNLSVAVGIALYHATHT